MLLSEKNAQRVFALAGHKGPLARQSYNCMPFAPGIRPLGDRGLQSLCHVSINSFDRSWANV